MCGICAAISDENQIENVVSGLKKLEYRGYDSCGIAFLENDKIKSIKCVGEISGLIEKTRGIFSSCVIGHTRWATHGVANEINAHPHFSFDKKFAIVHNGIIENYDEIRKNFLNGIKLETDTDTEIMVNLFATENGNMIEKIVSGCKKIKGSYAFALINCEKKKIYLAKRNSPLYVAVKNDAAMAGSDISVFAGQFDAFFALENDEIAEMSVGRVVFYDKNGKIIKKEKKLLNKYDFLDENLNEKYFMLKEIKQQPFCLKKSHSKYFHENIFQFISEIKKYNFFHFIACGTAYHACLMGSLYLEEIAGKNCETSIASEFRYSHRRLRKNCLYVFVSQSGETADTIACAKMVKAAGCKTLCITNVEYSTLNRLADFSLPTFAGKEIAVASTKAYTSQIFALLVLAKKLAGEEFADESKRFVSRFDVDFEKFENMLDVTRFEKVFFVGRQQDYVASLEGSLKLKEIAYINCLGLPAGELKHGTLALVDSKTLVIVISTVDSVKGKIESNIKEIQARNGKIMLVTNLKHNIDVDFTIRLDDFDKCFMPIVSVIPLQVLAFDTALRLGHNPDRPRNLAKSVTVE